MRGSIEALFFQRLPAQPRIRGVAEAAMAGAVLMVRAGSPESELLTAAKRGDLDAFERLVMMHERRIYGVALRIAGNAEDAQDATQEAFIRLHRKLDTIDSERSVGPWLCTVVANACRDLGRERKRSKLIPMDSASAVWPDPSAGPERLAAGQQRESHLRQAIRQLPEKERAALLLREVEGLTTGEVARVLGSSEATVRSQISSARLKLRQVFAARFGGSR